MGVVNVNKLKHGTEVAVKPFAKERFFDAVVISFRNSKRWKENCFQLQNGEEYMACEIEQIKVKNKNA